jgi:hypothetical protein
MPQNVAHYFGLWIKGAGSSVKKIISMGGAVVLWSIWLCRNDYYLQQCFHFIPYAGFVKEHILVQILEQSIGKGGAKEDQGLVSETGGLFNRYLCSEWVEV